MFQTVSKKYDISKHFWSLKPSPSCLVKINSKKTFLFGNTITDFIAPEMLHNILQFNIL